MNQQSKLYYAGEPFIHLYGTSCEAERRVTYPFDSLQVSFQQAVQRKGDDVVHVLELEEGEERERQTEKS